MAHPALRWRDRLSSSAVYRRSFSPFRAAVGTGIKGALAGGEDLPGKERNDGSFGGQREVACGPKKRAYLQVRKVQEYRYGCRCAVMVTVAVHFTVPFHVHGCGCAVMVGLRIIPWLTFMFASFVPFVATVRS